MNYPVVLFGFVLTLSSSFGQTHFISLFNAAWREEFNLSHGEIGGLYSLATLCSAICLIYLGKLIDSIDLRLYTATVMAGLAAAGLLMSGADSLSMLVLSFFMLRLFGQGLSGHVGQTVVSRYAEQRRGLSLSICGLGFSVGESVMPATVALLLGWIGWRQIWQGVAVIELAVALLLALWLLKRFYPLADQAGSTSHDKTVIRTGWSRRQVLTDKCFWLAVPALFAPSMFITAFFFHQQSLAEYKQIEFSHWALTIIGYSAGSVLMSLLAGMAVDRWSARRVVCSVLLPLFISCWWIDLSVPLVSLVFFALMGASQGILVPAAGVLWMELYGTAHIGAIRALAHAFMVFSSALGPVLFGLLLDAGFDWSLLLQLSMLWILLVSLLLWIAMLLAGKRPALINE